MCLHCFDCEPSGRIPPESAMVHALYEKERRALHSEGQSGQTQSFLSSTCDEAASTRQIRSLGTEHLPFVWKQCRPSTGQQCSRDADEGTKYTYSHCGSRPILTNRPNEANRRVVALNLLPGHKIHSAEHRMPREGIYCCAS